MAANSENSSRPSLESFRLCVQSICPKFNVSSLKESQFQALYSFICGEEVFVNLPTGSGKSLIFSTRATRTHVDALSAGDLRHQYGIFGGESQTSLFPFRSSGREWEAAVFAGYYHTGREKVATLFPHFCNQFCCHDAVPRVFSGFNMAVAVRREAPGDEGRDGTGWPTGWGWQIFSPGPSLRCNLFDSRVLLASLRGWIKNLRSTFFTAMKICVTSTMLWEEHFDQLLAFL